MTKEESSKCMCTVRDLIKHLSQYDLDANICYGEMNAFDEGFWQHIDPNSLKFFVRSVAEEKEHYKQRIKQEYKNMENSNYKPERTESEELEKSMKDFVYVNDHDVIVRF